MDVPLSLYVNIIFQILIYSHLKMMHSLDLKKKLYLYQSSMVIHYKVVAIINKQISLYCMIIFF